MSDIHKAPEPEDYLMHRAEEVSDWDCIVDEQECLRSLLDDEAVEVLMKLHEDELYSFFGCPSDEELEAMYAS